MSETTLKLIEMLDYMKTIDGERPDEALRLSEVAISLVDDTTDAQVVLDCRYRRLYYYAVLGHDKEGLKEVDTIMTMALNLEDWVTYVKALNVKGNFLGSMGVVDEALEAYVHALRYSEKHNVPQMVAVVSNNIGGLYHDLNDMVRAKEYYTKSLNVLESSEKDANLVNLQCTLTLNLADSCMQIGDFEAALEYVKTSEELINHHQQKQQYAHAQAIKSEIYQRMGDVKKAQLAFEEARDLYESISDSRNRIELLLTYSQFLIAEGGSEDEFVALLKEAETLSLEGDHQKPLIKIYGLLADYYEAKDMYNYAVCYYKSYHQANQAFEKMLREQQLNVMRMRFEIEQSAEEKELINRKNEELKEKSEELLKKKEELEQAYHRIQIISEIGQKITSTLDLSEIVLAVHDNLIGHMPIDSFYMAMLNETKQYLVSVATIDAELETEPFNIHIDNPNSILALSYREKRTLLISDVEAENELESMALIRKTELPIRSILCVPLLYDDMVIGVCSVQSVAVHAYEKEHLDIIGALSTYLAIAINNAQKSQRLEVEIQMRQKTQKELERLNAELKNISEIDGLTKVPNRRRFENVYEQMFEVAMSQGQYLHVLMMDIDYFKVYNDHYGHLKGDEVLIDVAQKLNMAFRFSSRLFARYGGEEFVAVLSDMTVDEAIILAQELRVAIANLGIYHELSPTGYLTISIGVASMIPKSAEDMRRLLYYADERLYLSKENGRNRVESTLLESTSI